MKILTPVVCLSMAIAAPVAAQDFLGGLARSAAQSAAQGLANRAVSAITTPRRAPPASTPPAQPQGAASVPTATATAPSSGLPADFPAPVPLNFAPALRDPTQLRFSQADMDGPKRFDEIGRYACNDCEGGFAFDSWARHEVSSLWGQYVLENRLGALPVGGKIEWTGSHTRTRYAITVVSDRPLGAWPCKQLKWTGDRGETHVERLGLICKPTENWHTAL